MAGNPMSDEAGMFEIVSNTWPERRGCMAYIVTEDLDPKIYPRHGLAKGDVIIRIVNDPLDPKSHHAKWSCVLSRRDLRKIA
jgi:hypothetical protein